MPWHEVEKMDLRKQFVARWLEGQESLSRLCMEFGISRKTGYKWVGRFEEEGYAGLEDRSRRPLVIARGTEGSVVEALLEKRRAYPFWGARKLCRLMEVEGAWVPAERTANRILKRHGLTRPREREAGEVRRFERGEPNDLWQMDHKGAVHGPGYRRMVPFQVLDDCSRYIVALKVLPDKGLDASWGAMWEAFGENGLPYAILSDNDLIFHGRSGPSQFEARLMRLGINILHGRPYHPQTQGKVERANGTLELEVLKGRRFRTPEELQAAIDAYRERYNYVRPHEALGLRVPGSVYRGSNRRRPSALPEMEYPCGAVLRRATKDGWISWRGYRIGVGAGVAGQAVEVREGTEGIEIYFGPYRLPGEFLDGGRPRRGRG